ncbi:hypothetical protein PLESTB_001738500 [Pleodorina starrii]|uniref:3'-5' exonuclease domain-containing protein n=1 Tax=Pleodorina starrii TaxID=330485 RepID=A0A9W6F9F6_9CHLO|nr:hypothetical protein PLESTM_000746600 [Pleodorina starrii]GLC61274.1 hypothetical protein PLESTB_001738500 [Pleodorina starrii]GLC74720.1 hypothetical protein PLESTF_001548100 [Pleodorina starrii]
MALTWRSNTSRAVTNTIRAACLVLTTGSPAAIASAPEGAALLPATALFSVPSHLKSELFPATGWPLGNQVTMTTLRPPMGRVRRVRGSGAESDCDDEAPSCSHADDVRAQPSGRLKQGSLAIGARRSLGCRSGTHDGGCLPPGPLDFLPSSLKQLRRSTTTAVGSASEIAGLPGPAAVGAEGDSTFPSASSALEEPQSDESHLSPYRGSHQPPQEKQQQLQQLQQHPEKKRDRHSSAPSVTKSAKRRAAEALLAARLGGAAPTACEGLNDATAAAVVVTCCCAGAAGGQRHRCSSSSVPTDSRSTGTAVDGPGMPSAGRPSSGAANPTGIPSGLSLLQRQADSLAAAAAAAAGEHAAGAMAAAKAAVKAAAKTDAASAAVPRQPIEVPGPPSKRARLSLSAAAASSLGAGLFGASQSQQASASAGAAAAVAATRVPPCDPARGCKVRLREAAEAMAAAATKRRGSAAAALGGAGADGSVGWSSPEGADLPGNGGTGGGGGAAAVIAGSRAAAPANEPVWCGFEVTLPSVNWQAVFDEPPGALQRFSIARGYEKLVLPQGLVTYVVENERHVGDALRHLKAGMQDRLIAIDLEWRPETVSGRVSPVALLQLSSARVCVVVRTCCMGYGLPPDLAAFLKEAQAGHVLLGFGWDSADEAKMRGTFGLGRADFGKFLDLQEVASSLGYHGFGLSRLSQQVLGLPLHKSKSISRSNWAAPQLTNHQLKYASLDVLVAGQLFRALRLWHSSPSPCADCRSPIGELLLPGPLRCGNPDCTTRPAANLAQHRDHCAATGHQARYAACATCGRLYELREPSP